jgi:hypothetical protein
MAAEFIDIVGGPAHGKTTARPSVPSVVVPPQTGGS